MNKKIFTSGVLMLLLQFLSGCGIYWARSYGGPKADWGAGIMQVADNGSVVVGKTQSAGAGDFDAWVVRLDRTGEIVWQKAIGGPKNDVACCIQQTLDNGYLIGGETASFGAQAAWVLKLDSRGRVVRQKAYGGTLIPILYALDRTFDGGAVAAGMSHSPGATDYDAWIMKLKPDGAVDWSKTYGGTRTDFFTSVQQTYDGGYIVAGLSESFGGGRRDVWVLKLGPDGSIMWQKTYDRFYDGQVSSIQETSDGGYIATGWHWTSKRPGGAVRKDLFVWKLDTDGMITWQKQYVGNGGTDAQAIRETAGGYLAAGAIFGAGAKGGDDADLLLIKLDPRGEIVWQKRYGGPRSDIAQDVRQTNDRGYLVAGSSYSFGAGNADLWIVKVLSDGKIVFGPGSKAVAAATDLTADDTFVIPVDTRAAAKAVDISVFDTDATVADTRATVAVQSPRE